MNDFLLQMIPNTVVDAFARGNILSVVLVSLLFGFALSSIGAAMQAAGGSDRIADASNIRRRKYFDAFCSHRRLRRNGVHG